MCKNPSYPNSRTNATGHRSSFLLTKSSGMDQSLAMPIHSSAGKLK